MLDDLTLAATGPNPLNWAVTAIVNPLHESVHINGASVMGINLCKQYLTVRRTRYILCYDEYLVPKFRSTSAAGYQTWDAINGFQDDWQP